ncbi:Blue-light-activated protein [Flavobacterium sp. PL0002]|nr:Blue-light-activated protein [Flavobacterium sp. PL002]
MDRNGIEALLIRNKLYPSIIFILIAEKITIEDCVQLLKQGVNDIVLKQMNSSLAQKISRALKETVSIKCKSPIEQFEKDKFWQNDLKYHTFIENCMDAIIITIKDGLILKVNAAACVIFEMTQEEMYKLGGFRLVDHTDPRLQLYLEERNITGRANGELKFKRKDGSSFPCEITSVVFKSLEGNEMTFTAIKDLTEYKKVQHELTRGKQELQEARNSLYKIMDASTDIICFIDSEKRIIQINAACKGIWGYEPYELVGEKYYDFIHPEDIEITFNTDENFRNGNPVKIFETRIIHKNGTIVYLQLTAQWREDDKLIYCTAKDISNKKNLEKAYEIERQRFLDLYNLSPSCMGILNGADQVFQMANPPYLKLINKKDIIGKTIMEVLPELKSQGTFELLNAVYTTGEPLIANEMLFKLDLQGDGNLEDNYLNFLFQAHRDNNNKINGVLFFIIDVTEQVLSRMKIEESEKLYRQLIRELPVATYSCNSDGKITIFNKAAVELWGREPEIESDLWSGAWKILNAHGELIPSNLYPMAIALKEGTIISNTEIIIERQNGEKRFVIPYIVPYIDKSGKITGAVNMLTDITESKAAQKILEQRNQELADYKYALDQSSIVGITDEKGIIIHVNDNFCRISKYSREELIGLDYKIFNSGHHSKEYISNLWETITHGKTWKGEFKNKAKDGSYYWVDTTITPFLNDRGKPYQYVTTRFDITERKNAELNLEMQNKELLKINNELDRFVYSVSHDLRSPLTSIQGLVSIIEDETNEPETLEHALMIKSSINRLDEFIRKILSYSQNKRTALEIETIPVKKTILDIVDLLQNMAQAKEIHFEIEMREHSTFHTDLQRFNTIIENVISNAIKYHKPIDSQRFIKVIGTVTDKILELKISDNGIGIETKYQEKIFDMFFRISSKSQGSGIGLYIVKDTIEKLQGSIRFHSQINVGTTFYITLKNFTS